MSVAECKEIENRHGHVDAFWNGWNAAFDGQPNLASDLVVLDGGIVTGLNYLCRQALRCVHRDAEVDLGFNWVVPTSELMDQAVLSIFC
jgi:hypothetical protein